LKHGLSRPWFEQNFDASISYERQDDFHGGATGSNPVGAANNLHSISSQTHYETRHVARKSSCLKVHDPIRRTIIAIIVADDDYSSPF
jgi:hypothetical protein